MRKRVVRTTVNLVSFLLVTFLAVDDVTSAPTVDDITADVFENRITPIYVRAATAPGNTVTFAVKRLPTAGILSDPLPVSGSPNIAVFLYTNVVPGVRSDTFTYTATDSTGTSDPAAEVSIRIREAGLRWDLFAAGATSATEDTNAFSNANFLFRLDWLVKEPWRKGDPALVAPITKMMGAYLKSGTSISTDSKESNPMNRALNARFTFETGVVSVPVIDQPSQTLEGASAPEAPPQADAEGEETPEPIQTTRNALTFGGQFVASLVGGAGDGRSMFEIGAGGRASYKIPVNDDQLVKKDGVTFVNLGELNRDSGFGVYEVFARFRLAQLEDEDNNAYDVSKLVAASTLHKTHPKNLEDLLVIEAGLQRNEGLRMAEMGTDQSSTRTLNRWFVRFMATPEIPNAGHTKALFGVEINNDRDDGLRNVRVFYGVNVALGRLFQGS